MQTRIVILISCVSKMESEGNYKPHNHPYCQLNHILKGEITYVVDGKSYVAHAGDTVLVPQNSVHSLALTSEEEGYYFEVKFTTMSKQDKEMCDDISIFTPGD